MSFHANKTLNIFGKLPNPQPRLQSYGSPMKHDSGLNSELAFAVSVRPVSHGTSRYTSLHKEVTFSDDVRVIELSGEVETPRSSSPNPDVPKPSFPYSNHLPSFPHALDGSPASSNSTPLSSSSSELSSRHSTNSNGTRDQPMWSPYSPSHRQLAAHRGPSTSPTNSSPSGAAGSYNASGLHRCLANMSFDIFDRPVGVFNSVETEPAFGPYLYEAATQTRRMKFRMQLTGLPINFGPQIKDGDPDITVYDVLYSIHQCIYEACPRSSFIEQPRARQRSIESARDARDRGDVIRWIDWVSTGSWKLLGLKPIPGIPDNWVMVMDPTAIRNRP
ncbi:hypothetical protein H0H93_003618 [Arthromyces matolae]|nr:hypothetical protein H0H93_003618 [Arthromyces matolae]